jgi:hypothetical protein
MNNNSTASRRRRRWGRIATVGLVATTALMLAAGSAHAIPPDDGDGPPPPPDGNLTIGGRVSLSGCPGVSADRVTVFAVGMNPFTGGVGSDRASSTGAYTITDLPPGRYNVVAKLDPGVCPYGAWSPTSQQVFAPRASVNFTYRGPSQVLRVSAPLVASVVNGALQNTLLHLDNHGPLHGQSHQLDNGSFLRWGGVSYPFTLPEIQYDLDCGLLCPDIGQARFYADNLDLTSLAVGWSRPSFVATLVFESNGREVKGYYTDATTGIVSDSLMPDVNIDNARLTAALTPIADGGRLSYRVAGVSLSANIQATGPCGFFWDVCDFFSSYKAKIKSEIENAVRAKLSDSSVRGFVAAALDTFLTGRGMPTVNRVFIEGDTLVLVA